ncbi:MAG: F0F1 ATP synthase subunit epsilon [Rhodobiaceae bacterium]|nr:F0F1 ATP synthase subunit epsilon [Rhodobiaceae bacterium]
MAKTFKFELVSPEKLVISGNATQVVVPGSEGAFAVLPGHAPVMSTLKPGVLDITMDGEAETRIFVRGGFAEGGPESLTVLAEQAIPMAELDAAALAEEVRNAEDDVKDARDDETRARASERLDHLRQLQGSL